MELRAPLTQTPASFIRGRGFFRVLYRLCIVINSLAFAPKRDVRIYTGVRHCVYPSPLEEALLLEEEPWQMFVVYEPIFPDAPDELGYEAVLIDKEDAMLNGFTCTFAEYMADPNSPPLRI